jgi:hypothetical protein
MCLVVYKNSWNLLPARFVYIGECERYETDDKETEMNLKAKIAIFLLAALITLVGFNLIASSPALDIMKVGKQAGYEIIANVLARADLHRS